MLTCIPGNLASVENARLKFDDKSQVVIPIDVDDSFLSRHFAFSQIIVARAGNSFHVDGRNQAISLKFRVLSIQFVSDQSDGEAIEIFQQLTILRKKMWPIFL
jgi:hypothetical protein